MGANVKVFNLLGCVISVMFSGSAPAQIIMPSTRGTPISIFGEATDLGTKITEMPVRKGLTGSGYLYEDWLKADIIFSDQDLRVQDIPVKIDINRSLVEIQYKNQIKILDASHVYSLILKAGKDTLITANALDQKLPYGFFRLIYNGQSTLLCHHSTRIKPANYNVALDVGSKNDEIVKVETYYAILNGKPVALENRRNALKKQFSGNKKIFAFIKKNRINPKREADLVDLVKFYERLSGK